MYEKMWRPITHIRKDDTRVVLPSSTTRALIYSMGPAEVTERMWLQLELRNVTDRMEDAVYPMKKRSREALMKRWSRAYPRLLMLHGHYEATLACRALQEFTGTWS